VKRLAIAAVLAGSLPVAIPAPSVGAGRPAPSDVAWIAARLAPRLSAEVAAFIGRAILRAALRDLRDGKYTTRAAGVTPVGPDLGPCVALPQSFEVVMQATEDGLPVSRDPLSAAVPYDPNVRVLLTSVVKVEVAAFYPVKGLTFADGRLVLPKEPLIVAGYRGKEGERSTWTYHGGGGWDDEKKKAVANDLTLKALDVARERYATARPGLEADLARTFGREIDRLIAGVNRPGPDR
jgi:hypothetical protein